MASRVNDVEDMTAGTPIGKHNSTLFSTRSPVCPRIRLTDAGEGASPEKGCLPTPQRSSLFRIFERDDDSGGLSGASPGTPAPLSRLLLSAERFAFAPRTPTGSPSGFRDRFDFTRWSHKHNLTTCRTVSSHCPRSHTLGARLMRRLTPSRATPVQKSKRSLSAEPAPLPPLSFIRSPCRYG